MRKTWLGAMIAVTLGAGGLLAASAEGSQATGHDLRGGVIVQDVRIPVPGQAAVTTYLVRPEHAPARPNSLAGLLYLHWFEPPGSTQNRTEFLAEAVELAGKGAVAVLPQLTFPWAGDPVGTSADRQNVEQQLAAVTEAYRYLTAQPGVDRNRTAVVGHDYGAMYGSILAQRTPSVHAAVLMAADATWANWFDKYWLGLPDADKPAYRALWSGLDPIANTGRLGPHLYQQWAGRDQFIPIEVRNAFAAANPQAKVSYYERADHFLDQPAKDDRIAFLSVQLGV